MSKPKRTMAVMKGLHALAALADGQPIKPSMQRNVAKATEWIIRIEAYDSGESLPPKTRALPTDAEPDCIGDS